MVSSQVKLKDMEKGPVIWTFLNIKLSKAKHSWMQNQNLRHKYRKVFWFSFRFVPFFGFKFEKRANIRHIFYIQYGYQWTHKSMLILNPLIKLQKSHAKKVRNENVMEKSSFFTCISMCKSSFVLLSLVFSKKSKSIHPTIKVL